MKVLLNDFELYDGVLFQKSVPRKNDFAEKYLSLRKKEGRVYSDEQVRGLPEIVTSNSHYSEWLVRKKSLTWLVRYLSKKDFNTVLEVGCGNGWLSSSIAKTFNADVLGMDLNEPELKQASRAFNCAQNLSFSYGDIFTAGFNTQFDIIVIASSVQYFKELDSLLKRLLSLLTPEGEIIIMDSPFYISSEKANDAYQRSLKYFQSMGSPEMGEHYYHHTTHDLKNFYYSFLLNPSSALSLVSRFLLRRNLPKFPIISIKAQRGHS